MSTASVGRARAGERVRRRENWFAALGARGRRAFRAAFAGYMLDAFDRHRRCRP